MVLVTVIPTIDMRKRLTDSPDQPLGAVYQMTNENLIFTSFEIYEQEYMSCCLTISALGVHSERERALW